MKNDLYKTKKEISIRQKAEQLLKNKLSGKTTDLTEADNIKLIYELKVHQIELEIQHEELQFAKEKAEINAEKYTNLYDYSPSGCFSLDADGIICELNLSGAKMIGKEQSYLINNNFNLFITSNTRNIFNDFLIKAFDTKTKQNCEVQLTIKGKSTLFVKIEGIFSKTEQKCLLTVVDITKHKKTEDKLKKSEEKLNSIMKSMDDIVFQLDKENCFILVNAPNGDLYLKPEMFLGKKHSEVLPKHIDDLFNKALINVKKGKTEEYEYSLEIHDKIYWYALKLSPIINNGKFDGTVSVIRDVTKRKKSEQALKESEERWRSLFQDIPNVAVQGYDKNEKTTYWNKASETVYGYSSKEAIGSNITDLIIPKEAKSSVSNAIKEMFRTKIPIPASELKLKHKDDSTIFVFSSHSYIEFPNQEPEMYCLDIDITEQKKGEEALKESEERFRNMFKTHNAIMLIIEPETGLIIDANNAAVNFYGYSKSELISMNINEINTLSPEETFIKMKNTKIKKCNDFIFSHKLANGTKKIVEVYSSPIEYSGNNLLFSIIHDITDRKNAEEELKESEIKYKAVFLTSPDAIILTKLDGEVVDINEGFTRLTGFTKEDVIGKFSFKIKIWKNLEDRNKLIQGLKKYGIVENLESVFIKKDGSVRTSLMSAKIIILKNKQYILSITRDISDRKAIENDLLIAKKKAEENEKYYSNILNNIGDPVFVKDEQSRFLLVNDACCKLFGSDRDNMIGKTLAEKVPLKEQESFLSIDKEVLEIGRENINQESFSIIGEEPKIISTRKSRYIDINGNKLLIGTIHDITEKQKTEKALQRTQKLESLGILAGGIAHDFNNLLSIILGNIEIAKMKTTEEQVSTLLTNAMSGIDRSRALTQQLLTFSKGGTPIKRINKLFPFIQKTAQFALSGSSILSKFHIQKDLWSCNFDKNQIGQVIDNLIINAQQAMPNGGTIEVSAINITFLLKEHNSLDAGDYVKLSIKDQGVGMPKDLIPRIFDPYYTTKSQGHGLGLSTCYSIIYRHGGCIDIESEPCKGSTFQLYLPASNESISTTTIKSTKKHMGSGTFLVMDDEEPIQNLIKMILKSFGYNVVVKKNGKDAVDFFNAEFKANRKIAGMIFDLTIPGGMGGKEAISEIRKVCLETPVFVASGYSTSPVMANPEKYGFTASLSKPFMMTDLTALLEKHIKK